MKDQFYSQRLQEKLSAMSNAVLTIVEAPAGYGKTTAVRFQLDQVDSKRVFWYTAVPGMHRGSVEWAINHIAKLDPEIGAQISNLGLLNRSNIHKALRILGNLRCKEDAWLVVDNFQFAMDEWYPQLLFSLANLDIEKFHAVLISQNFGPLRSVFDEMPICRIGMADLLLNAKEIQSFAAQLGREITNQQAAKIYQVTEGWVAAVNLYVHSSFSEKGEGLEETDIDTLLYQHFWKKLSQKEQQCLLSFAPYEQINMKTAEALLRSQELTMGLIRRAPMLRIDPVAGRIYPHEILTRFVNKRLQREPISFQKQVLVQAATNYLEHGELKNAVACYLKAEEWDRILSCDLKGLYADSFGGIPYGRVARQVLDNASESALMEHPLSALRLCVALFGAADYEGYERALEECRKRIEASGDQHMLGEWYMAAAYRHFPNIPAMTESYRKAETLLDGASRLVNQQDPFFFGVASPWTAFYSVPGELAESVKDLHIMMKVYNGLTQHHGAGIAELYRAELYSCQGKFDDSEIWLQRAALEAEKYQVAGTTYGIALIQGVNAIYQGDMDGLEKAIVYMESKARSYPYLKGCAIERVMLEGVRSYLMGLLIEPQQGATWTQGDADPLSYLNYSTVVANNCRITDMVVKKEYRKAIASMEAYLDQDPRLITLPVRVLTYCGLALANMARGHMVRAGECLDEALTLAEADHNFTFIASHRQYFRFLFLLPAIRSSHGAAIAQIKAMPLTYTQAEESRIFAMLEEMEEELPEGKELSMDGLTDREREIAVLIGQGMRNSEIAAALYISEETVKSHVKNIFRKLEVDRRSKLIEMLR